MVKAAEAKENRAPSVRTVRSDTERHLLNQIREATDVGSADKWMTLYERFQRCVNGVPGSLKEPAGSVSGQEAAEPGTEE